MAKKQKLPWFPFYPAEWLGERTLRGVSLAARGLWIEMLCWMWHAPRRGFLLDSARTSVSTETLAKWLHAGELEVSRLLDELESAQVFSRTKKKVIYCRRMAKDAELKELRAIAGSKSGLAKSLNKASNPSGSGSVVLLKQEDVARVKAPPGKYARFKRTPL